MLIMVLWLLLLSCTTTVSANDTISHTFFSARSSYTPPISQFVHSAELLEQTVPTWSSLEATVYTSGTTNPRKIAEYFLPFNLQQLHVMEYKPGVVTSDLIRDKTIEARHFNIQTQSGTSTFESIVRFKPQERVVGIGLQGMQVITRNENCTPKIWLSYTLPIEQVSRTMGLTETIINDGGGRVDAIGLDMAPRVGSMTEACRQKNWRFGKMDNRWHTATGLADISVELGWASCWNNRCHTSSVFGFIAPTGTVINSKTQEYVFAPVIGNNHHWALQYGTEISVTLLDYETSKLRFTYQAKGMIIVSNYQTRSFDLDDLQWSRYMEVYRSQALAQEALMTNDDRSGTSGINVFTKCIKVDPRSNSSLTGSLSYEWGRWEVEGGYHVFMRHAELTDLPQWNERTALKDVNGLGATNIARTINKNFTGSATTSPGDFTDSLIGIGQINFDSMAHPAVVDQTFFNTLAYYGSRVRAGIGASYQFSTTNATLDHWTFWGTVGVCW